MVDDASQTPLPFATAAGVSAPSATHFVTEGERKFDRVNYTWLGYVANVLLSVAAVAAVERTAGGQKFIENIGNWAKKNATFISPEKAEMLSRKTFFLSGGFAVLAPMKWMEDDKVPLIKKWNRKAYGDTANTDPAIVQSEHELEAAPKQSWSSVFSSRILALVPFYVIYGALWDRTSFLSKTTNAELHHLPEQAAKLMEKDAPAAFSQLTAKGFYIDKPIAAVSRWIGKGFAAVTGNEKALAKLETMRTTYPGTIRSSITTNASHDPLHSTVPYYFISEAITSAMVAWGVYALTRVMGPLFDKRKDETMKPVPWQPSSSAIPITERVGPVVTILPPAQEKEENNPVGTHFSEEKTRASSVNSASHLSNAQPPTVIHTKQLEHTGPELASLSAAK